MSHSKTNPFQLLSRLRRPEYTGENRCAPCTILNVAIALILGGGVGTVSVPLGVSTVGAAAVVIYLRGYLVPYTPTITKRYFPDRVLRWFDDHKTSRPPTRPDHVEELDIEATLSSLGVLTECEHVDDFCLDPSFRAAWRTYIEELGESDTQVDDIRALLDLGSDSAHDIRQRGNEASVVLVDGVQIGQWESEAALLADIAADRALREWTEVWDQFHVVNRSQLLNSLRMFLEECTVCSSPLSLGQESVESCCRSFEVVAVTCDECGSRFFEVELTDDVRRHL